jgi:hypothetical protein
MNGCVKVFESWFGLVRPTSRSFVRLTTPCFNVSNRSHNTEPQNMEFIVRVGGEEDRGFIKCRGKSRRVDPMLLELMRQIHIGLSLVYPAVVAVPNITIDYTATLFDLCDCPLPTSSPHQY